MSFGWVLMDGFGRPGTFPFSPCLFSFSFALVFSWVQVWILFLILVRECLRLFQSTFILKYIKIIFDINTSKRSKNTKNIINWNEKKIIFFKIISKCKNKKECLLVAFLLHFFVVMSNQVFFIYIIIVIKSAWFEA